MTSSSPAPKLPLWIFFATDALLIALGVLIAVQHPRPWSETIVIAVVVCFVVGAVVGLVPVLAYFERKKNEMLDDRQNALESLARTITNSAEQIGIAASGLHQITELAQKNLRHAEQLPQKLHEKIAEFQAQLANASDAEKEELEKELEELRATESERLQSTSDKIAKTVAEFSKVETATQQHLASANEALSKLSFGTASAIGKAQAAAEQALALARQEASRSIGDATGNAVKTIETAKVAAIADLTVEFEKNLSRFKELIVDLHGALDRASMPALSDHGTAVPAAPAVTAPADQSPEPSPEPVSTPDAGSPPAAKRSRKPRREESQPPASTETPASVTPEAAPPVISEPPGVISAPPTEPAPVTPERMVEIAPVAPLTAEPFTVQPSSAAPESIKPVRKKSRKSEDESPALGLGFEEPKVDGTEDAGSSAGVVERVLSSDGATRLLVTAYIGIGNRLFIRGVGPGLSWDKGVPLQFVSIGKWRWETNDAGAPIQFKLFKNDEQECAALGTLTVEPGHQHELTAAF